MADSFSTLNGYEVKDPEARKKINEIENRDFITGKNIAIIGDSNAALYMNSGLLEASAHNLTVQKLAVGGATFCNGNNTILTQLDRIEGNPDFILIWCGGNDAGVWDAGVFGVFNNVDYDIEDFNFNTTCGAIDYTIATLRRRYPLAKLVGFIRDASPLRNATINDFVFDTVVKIYEKWNVPVIDMRKVGNITSAFPESLNANTIDDRHHYNNEALKTINSLIVGAFNSGLNVVARPEETVFMDNNTDNITTVDAVKNACFKFMQSVKCAYVSKAVTLIDKTTLNFVNGLLTAHKAIGFAFMRLSTLTGKISVYVSNVDGSVITEKVVPMMQTLTTGNVATLDTGRYYIMAVDKPNIAQLPSDDATLGGLLIVDKSLLSDSSIYEYRDFNGVGKWHGFRNSSDVVNWVTM